MEHEVHVPFPVGSVRAALAEAERGMRCVPGLTVEAGAASGPDATAIGDATAGDATGAAGERTAADEVDGVDEVVVRGRLRVRIGGSTVTYRGTLRLTAREPGFVVEADGTEARGAGTARMELTVVPREAARSGTEESGTVLAFTGAASGQGRIAEFEEKQLRAAGRRLLDRFAESLADSLAADPPGDDNAPVIPGIPAPDATTPDAETTDGKTTDAEAAAKPAAGEAEAARARADAEETSEEAPAPQEATGGAAGESGGQDQPPQAVHDEDSGLSVFETEIPPPSLDRTSDEGDPSGTDPSDADRTASGAEETPVGSRDPFDDPFGNGDADGSGTPPGLPRGAEIPAPGAPPAEAAHARRTMIGRSAEEVDHAPPRGRYAPVPPPAQTAPGATLRWAAPAAALAVAGVVVLSRAVRRRNR
ncbi:serine/arginine repetitive matrix protein 1 [Streptomyces sp. XM4193]|uniref:serine/arginine repetitive matrix protein 1 n=1 Tax=Streptomyces sp. XM4193 TaxID=2929782 RepID=UPI001FFB5794|nr:serine/arginine repetitive matrix protein 1 [Streptomyces sp. XM4193]MCK1794933.1 serine/arginine repetitive matrix protein 1 [Streptomyces sp. XM4193]